MPGVYVGNTKSLVFPMMCDGYIKQVYLDSNPANTNLEVRGGHWGQTTPFTFEVIMTPYDVNGYGNRTGTGSGITNSEKTTPSLSTAVTSNTGHYQSNYYFNNRHAQKMHLFYNKNFELYLENTTLGNFNQPAEYKIVAKIHQNNLTKVTATSDTIIKANNMLHGYYDADGYYNGMTTQLTKLTSNAINVTPSKEITVANNNFTGEVNVTAVAATGSVTISGTPEAYYPAQSATAQINFSNNSFSVDTNPSTGSGTIKFGANPSVASASTTTTEYIEITNQDSTVTKWICGDGSSPTWDVDGNGFLNPLNWPANSRIYRSSSSAENTLAQLVSGINAYNAGWSGTVTGGPDPADSTASPPAIVATLTTAITGSSPNRTGAGGSITIGSGMASGIVRTQISGGSAETVVAHNYITINSGGGNKLYHPYSIGTYFNGETLSRTHNGVTINVIAFNVSNSVDNTMIGLRNAINHSNGNTQITASHINGGVSLVADSAGTGGNSYTLTATANITNETIVGWANGENVNNATQHIELIDSDGTTTKFLAAHATKSTNVTGSILTISSVDYVIYRLPTSGSNRTNFAAAVNSVSALDITAVNDGSNQNKVNLTQGTVGEDGNKTISNNASNVSVTSFTGGVNAANPSVSIDITDADNTLIKYKPSVNESNGSSDGTYTFFQKGADANATATNLASAINSGHSGDITATTPGNSNTVKIVMATAGGAYAISENSSSITLAGNNNTFDTSGNQNITVGAGELNLIGAGEKIYDSNSTLIGTVASVNGNVATLSDAPATPVTSVLYVSQPREALYSESTYRISCSYTKESLKIYVNGTQVASTNISSTVLSNFFFDPDDSWIGKGKERTESGGSYSYTESRTTQFMGELYEICMISRGEPTSRNSTLSPGLSDIIFYYRFGDE